MLFLIVKNIQVDIHIFKFILYKITYLFLNLLLSLLTFFKDIELFELYLSTNVNINSKVNTKNEIKFLNMSFILILVW